MLPIEKLGSFITFHSFHPAPVPIYKFVQTSVASISNVLSIRFQISVRIERVSCHILVELFVQLVLAYRLDSSPPGSSPSAANTTARPSGTPERSHTPSSQSSVVLAHAHITNTTGPPPGPDNTAPASPPTTTPCNTTSSSSSAELNTVGNTVSAHSSGWTSPTWSPPIQGSCAAHSLQTPTPAH
uniref:Uncharacterized protein n=1 Tax=Cacopsylla melanoneura TaxID=428564 RepID=A0A8D8LIH3_9HEMI